jgi:hypothetical protein
MSAPATPSFVVICLRQCPRCGVGGERFVLPLPFGGANHKCSQCGGFVTLLSNGFTDSFKLPDSWKLDPPA